MIFNYEKEPIYPVKVCFTITILTHPEICITKAPWQKDSILKSECLRGWTRTGINGETDRDI